MTPYGCYNRPAPPAFVTVQDGWMDYGPHTGALRKMVTVPYPFAPGCRYDARATDQRCEGCRER